MKMKNKTKRSKKQKISCRNYDTDYADDLALLRKPNLPSLEQAADAIGLNIRANKTVYMCFK